MTLDTAKLSLDALCNAPCVELGQWPTPVVEVALVGQPSILVKRDDLSGWGRGGAKARKIRYLLGYMRDRGYTDLVTVAGNITNLAFDLIPALDRAGLGAHLHIIDDPPAPSELRRRIFEGVGHRVCLLGSSRCRAFLKTGARVLQLRAKGRRPLWVLPGVSHPTGVLGNACGFVEVLDQLGAEGRKRPQTVFITGATGTTLAGFVLAEAFLRGLGQPPIRIIGVQIYPGALHRSTRWLAHWAARFVGLRQALDLDVRVTSEALNGGFGCYDRKLVELCERVEEQVELKLDPIFGGKTWSVMERYLRRERPRDGEVLYWHCGYTPEWRDLKPELSTQ